MKPRGGPRGSYRKLGSRDIHRHTCVKEVCRTLTAPAGPLKEKHTVWWWCVTCHRDMGSQTSTRKRLE